MLLLHGNILLTVSGIQLIDSKIYLYICLTEKYNDLSTIKSVIVYCIERFISI